MPTSGANPSRPFYDVRVDVPAVVHGYPAPPPPPPYMSGATTDNQAKPSTSIRVITSQFIVIASMFSLLFLLIYATTRKHFPRFQLDSVSVSVHNTTTAVWDIGFSIDRAAGDLDVWARFMSRDFKAESPGNSAGEFTVSISTLLPRGGGTTLRGGPGVIITLEQVVFKCNDYRDTYYRLVFMAACKDVAVEISSNETTAGEMTMMMKGGSRLCPIVFQQIKKDS